MITDLKRSIDFRWLLISGAIFLSDDLILLFAVGDAAPGPSRWSRAVGGSWSSFGGLPALSFPRMDLWLGRERVTQRRVMLLQGAVHQHVHVVETQSVKPSEKTTLPQTKKGPIFLRSHPLLLYSTLLGFVGAFGTILVSRRRELLKQYVGLWGHFVELWDRRWEIHKRTVTLSLSTPSQRTQKDFHLMRNSHSSFVAGYLSPAQFNLCLYVFIGCSAVTKDHCCLQVADITYFFSFPF